MPEYIEREAVKAAIMRVNANLTGLLGFVDAIPAADVAPVVHGRWIMKHKHRGGFHRYTGIDDMGEKHTITVDERVEYDDRYCSECGKQSADNFLKYCPNCGARMDSDG